MASASVFHRVVAAALAIPDAANKMNAMARRQIVFIGIRFQTTRLDLRPLTPFGSATHPCFNTEWRQIPSMLD